MTKSIPVVLNNRSVNADKMMIHTTVIILEFLVLFFYVESNTTGLSKKGNILIWIPN